MQAAPEQPGLVVLVIEDNDQDFFLLQRQLRRSGDVHLERVISLAEGVATLAEKDIDLVLLDLSLPDSQGLDTVTRLVAESTAPTVVLTATDDEDTGLHAVNLGAQDYLIKGRFDEPLLTRSIRYAVERFRLRDQLSESREVIRRERELRRLRRLGDQGTGLPQSQDSPAVAEPLMARNPSIYKKVLELYDGTLMAAIEQRGFRVNHDFPEKLRRLAEILGAWRATPTDLVDIHSSVLEHRLRGLGTGKSRLCTEEGRYLLTGVLGHLCSYYCELSESSLGEPDRDALFASGQPEIG